MITKMNKLTLLIYHKEYTAFLERLREVGVVHIAERENGTPENSELEELLALSARYRRVIKRLEALQVENCAPAGDVAESGAVLAEFDTIVAEIFPNEEYAQAAGITDIPAALEEITDKMNETALPSHVVARVIVRDTPLEKTGLGKIKRNKTAGGEA